MILVIPNLDAVRVAVIYADGRDVKVIAFCVVNNGIVITVIVSRHLRSIDLRVSSVSVLFNSRISSGLVLNMFSE